MARDKLACLISCLRVSAAYAPLQSCMVEDSDVIDALGGVASHLHHELLHVGRTIGCSLPKHVPLRV